MEASFISQNQARTVSKKALLIAALAIVAIVGTVGVHYAQSNNFLLSGLISNLPVTRQVVPQEFLDHLAKHNISLSTDEALARLPIFNSNNDFINKHNNKNKSYTLEANQFAHLTPEEFAATYLGGKPTDDANSSNSSSNSSSSETKSSRILATLPATLDWRNTSRVGPVKNQGSCGSCWAFSSIAVLEGLYGKLANSYASLSEQQLVDCANSSTYGSNGCSGGWPPSALKYAVNVGVTNEAAYPYTGVAGTCKTNVTANIKAGSVVTSAINATAFMQALQNGPSSIYVQADQQIFQFYKSGVLDDASCFTSGIDHAVTAVGYTSNAWIIRNSWGSSWGEAGYIRIAQDTTINSGKGVCGIYSFGITYAQ